MRLPQDPMVDEDPMEIRVKAVEARTASPHAPHHAGAVQLTRVPAAGEGPRAADRARHHASCSARNDSASRARPERTSKGCRGELDQLRDFTSCRTRELNSARVMRSCGRSPCAPRRLERISIGSSSTIGSCGVSIDVARLSSLTASRRSRPSR